MGAEAHFDADSTHSGSSDAPPEYGEKDYEEKDRRDEYEEDYRAEMDDERTRFLAPHQASPRSQSPFQPYQPTPRTPSLLENVQDWWISVKNHKDSKVLAVVLLFLTAYFTWIILTIKYTWSHRNDYATSISPGRYQRVQQCSITSAKRDLSFLDSAKPISADEFLQRRDRLAEALSENEVDAFVFEPGYTSQYYANISQADWEPWEPEERPFLTVIIPQTTKGGKITAKTAYLAPHFEEARVRMLGIPSRDKTLDIVTWEEHWNPYTTLLESNLFNAKKNPKIMVDEEIRDYISRGLQSNGFETVGLSPEVELVRQIKSPAEIEILRAVNTGTVAAVRAMRPCLVAKMNEDQVRSVLDETLVAMGFDLFFNVVLFEENGALPHGGNVVGNKTLTPDSMVIIDVGAHYLGYSSDITRSFQIDLDPETDKYKLDDPQKDEKERVWQIVLDAQTAAAKLFKPGNTAASVDLAARGVIEEAGYGPRFTHRLGHGIGIKAHESPYLNKWNKDVTLKAGMVFTNEPGIYLQNRFGVRHEDVYLVKKDGEAELLTGKRAKGLREP